MIPFKSKLLNEDFALLRTLDVWYRIKDNPYLEEVDLNIYTKTNDSIGAEYRSVILKMYLKNVFLKDKEKMGFVEKMLD